MKALLIGVVLLLLAPCRVLAQPPASPGLTPAQARAALDVLNDPKKRADVIATLEAIAKVQPAPAQPAGTPAVAPASATPPAGKAPAAGLPIPLAPNSLGAEVLVSAENFLNHLSTGMANGLHAMQSLPLLWAWVVVMTTTPWMRDLLLDAAWRVAVAVLCGLAAEFALRVATRRPIAALEALAPAAREALAPATGGFAGTRDATAGEALQAASGSEAVQDPGEADSEEPDDAVGALPLPSPRTPDNPVERAEAGDIEPPVQHRRRISAWVLLRRVPLVLARLVLDLIPVLGFVVAGHLVAGSAIGGQPGSRLVVLAVVDAYAGCAAVLSVARMLLSPRASRLRLFHLPDTLAAYLMRWTRRLVIIAVFGYAIGEVGLLLGLSDVAHDGLQKAVGFVLHACLAIIVLQKRRAVRRWLRAPPGASGADGAGAQCAWPRFGTGSRCSSSSAIWLVWAVEIPNGFTRLLHFCIVTALLLIGARLLLIVLDGSLDRVHVRAAGDRRALSRPGGAAAAVPPRPQRASLRALVYVLCGLALLQLYGFGTFTWFGESDLGHRVVSALGTLAVTLLLALAAWEAANAAIQRHLAKLAKEQQVARSARLRTLLPLLRSALLITILVVAGMMVLSEIGINIAPAAGRRRHHRRGDRLRLAEAGAGPDHRHLPAAGERHAGGRLRSPSPACPARWRTCRCAPSGCAPATARCTSSRSAR